MEVSTVTEPHRIVRPTRGRPPRPRRRYVFKNLTFSDIRRIRASPVPGQKKLTKQERRVMLYVIDGAMNKQIAWHLNISERTVKAHRSRMLEKIGCLTATDLVRMLLLPYVRGSAQNARNIVPFPRTGERKEPRAPLSLVHAR